MSKYCIYHDRPIATWASGEVADGCVIFGVHHDCETCPNMKEMGDDPFTSYSETNTATSKKWFSMTRAERAAMEAYPPETKKIIQILPKDWNKPHRDAFLKGYEQAEKATIERAIGWIKKNTCMGVYEQELMRKELEGEK